MLGLQWVQSSVSFPWLPAHRLSQVILGPGCGAVSWAYVHHGLVGYICGCAVAPRFVVISSRLEKDGVQGWNRGPCKFMPTQKV